MIHQQSSTPMSQEVQKLQTMAPLNNLEKFLANYNKFIEQNQTLYLNTATILSDIASNIIQPPMSPELYNLYCTGKQFPQILSPDSSQMQDLVSRIKRLKQDKIYQTILYIEQLNYKLSKGIELGVYNKGLNPNPNPLNQNATPTVNLENKKYTL